MNIPYVKKFNSDGVLINPITKGNPYLSPYQNRYKRNEKIKIKNNRKPYSDREIISRLVFVQRIMKFIENGKKVFSGILAYHRNNR